ncbi:AAA family ATPase [Mesocricetibacter intestinalis]|uniref:AAA family ATPase n=1 Tax=Mesocricetibacter intestinalis TaxID=1521930 RepID=UPI0010601421|nr:Lon protease family protein [Mesocricetibacter intestinalis]
MHLTSLSEQLLDWRELLPNLSLETLSAQATGFFDLQARAASALEHFRRNPHRNLLLLKADDQREYAELLMAHLQKYPVSSAPRGVHYIIEQADSFSFAAVSLRPAQSAADNFAATENVATALHFDQEKLFGALRIHPVSKDLQLTPGLVHRLNGGVLILGVNALLSQPELWLRLKHLLASGWFDWYSMHPFKPLPCSIPGYGLKLKLILLGSRTELAALAEFDEELLRLGDYSEIESHISIERPEQQLKWAQYVCEFARSLNFPLPTVQGLNRLYQLLVRESEDRSLINIAPTKLKELFSKASSGADENKTRLDAEDFERVFQQTQMQQSFLREQTYADIFHEQVYIPTEGEAVGQVNGLSVIEYQGTPLSFGEPSRISCIVQFGEGEIVDIDRKNELAGNIHSKGMMIAESCLANILELPSQLPFSASLVFEQSYGEIDGDSASLAEFCVLTSALSDLPLPQSIAVTGAIDQFGLVHAVGGVNDKIEGFFAICEGRGLSGEQGVIIPSAAIHQLSLSEAVVSAVKNQQFFIWTVEDVYQACEILFKRSLTEEEGQTYNETNLPVAHLISQRIELRSEAPKGGLWQLLFGRK